MSTLNIAIQIAGQDKGAGALISRLAGGLGDLGGVAAGVASFGLGVAVAGVAALGAGLGLAISEAMGAQEVMAQTEAVIKSTGGAAGMTAEAVADLATQLSLQSRFSDDAIQTAENLLLTFTNIGAETFPLATQAMVDMATAMGTDVSSGAIQLGKALNDPIAGISALSRVGVTFTDEQKAVIKSLVETGDVAGAQAVILAELNKEFGGSAAAAAETFGGKLDVVKNQLLNVAEGIGLALLPALTTLFDNVIGPALPIITELGTAFATFLGAMLSGDTAAGFSALYDGLAKVFGHEMAAQITTFISDLVEGVQAFVADAQVQAANFVTNIQPILTAVGNVAAAFAESMPMVQQYFADMVAFVLAQVNTLSPTLIANISDTLNQLAAFWQEHGETIMQVVNFAFRVIAVTIGGALTLLSGLLSVTMRAINGDWTGAWEVVQSTVATFMNAVLAIVGTDLETFIATWTANWEMAKVIVTELWTQLKDAVAAKVMELTSGIQQGIIDAITWLQTLPATFEQIGTDLMNGLKSGVLAAAAGLIAAVTGSINDAIAAAKALLGISSPSKLFAGIGANMMAGMAVGINATAGLPAMASAHAAAGAAGVVNNYYTVEAQYGYQAEGTVAQELALMSRLTG